MQIAQPHLGRELLFTAGGPLLVGACLGMPFGVDVFLRAIGGVPAVLFGVGLVMTPALYIGGAFLGTSPPIERVVAAARATARDLGLLLLGLFPALLFLEVTTQRESTVLVLGHVVVGVAVLTALLVFFRRLFDPPRPAAFLLYGVWSVVTLSMGWRAFLSVFAS